MKVKLVFIEPAYAGPLNARGYIGFKIVDDDDKDGNTVDADGCVLWRTEQTIAGLRITPTSVAEINRGA